jgi:lipoprotein-anchoring transpeptidase ErfK/SrfK
MNPAALAAILAGIGSPALAPERPLAARLVTPTTLYASPGGRRIARLDRQTEFRSRTVLAIARRRGPWLGVRAPQLPNGRLGWIRAAGAEVLSEPRTIEVDLSARRLLVRTDGRVTGRFTVGIGKPGTPTPTGRFAVTDRIDVTGRTAYGCCVLALTGHQPDLPQGWGGGDRIAIHGTSAPASVGRATSSGCMRASEATMRALMKVIPLGAPVTIRR